MDTSTAPQKRKVVALIRVSDPSQAKDDKTGIARQQADIEIIRERDNLEIVRIRQIVISGAHAMTSPDYREMLAEDVPDPKIDGVVCATLDRFFRPEDFTEYDAFKPFLKFRKPIFCEIGEVQPWNPTTGILIQVLGSLAGLERKRILQRTQFGKNLRRTDANCKSDTLPKGVIFVADDANAKANVGHFEYTPDSDRVKEAMRRVIARDTFQSIADDLAWNSVTAMRATLKSRWWIGYKTTMNKRVDANYRDDGTRSAGRRIKREEPIIVKTNLADTPLVSVEDFEAVQAILAEHRETWTKQTSRVNQFLGIGLLHCSCGERLYGKNGKNRKKGHQGRTDYYICASGYFDKAKKAKLVAEGKLPCSQKMLRSADIDREIQAHIMLMRQGTANIRAMFENILDAGAQALAVKEKERIEDQIHDLDKQETRLIDKMARYDDTTKFELKLQEVQVELATLKTKLAAHLRENKTVDASELDRVTKDLHRKYLDYPKLSIEKQKDLLRQTFLRISVSWNATDEPEDTALIFTPAMPAKDTALRA